jgi:hypothetical protein
VSMKIDWNVVTLGRVLGIAIILVGIVLAAWNARALHYPVEYNGEHYKIRYFFSASIEYVWRGGFLLVAAEVADRLGWGTRSTSEEPATDEAPS